MKLEIEISEDELKEAVLKVISNNYYRDYSADRNHVNRVVAEQVRRVIITLGNQKMTHLTYVANI